MECQRCGSKNCQAISEYVELEKKPRTFWLVILLTIDIVLFYLSFLSFTSGDDFDRIVGLYLLIAGVSLNIIYCAIRLIQPYKHVTMMRIVCLDCGTTIFQEKVTPGDPEEYIVTTIKPNKKLTHFFDDKKKWVKTVLTFLVIFTIQYSQKTLGELLYGKRKNWFLYSNTCRD